MADLSIAYHIGFSSHHPSWLMEVLEYELCSLDPISYSEQKDNEIILHSEDTLASISSEVHRILEQNGLTPATVTIERREITKQNWNEEWESQFEPIFLTPELTIRAPFHPPSITPHELVIVPKMSFGTGHHGTTKLIIEELIQSHISEAYMLDMGCGTGILGIAALLFGAQRVDFQDVDDWCVDNTLENLKLNHCPTSSYSVGLDTPQSLIKQSKTYDHILANINYNVLKEHLPFYSTLLATKTESFILLSGFYENEAKRLIEQLDSLGFNSTYTCLNALELVDRWCMIKASRR